MARRCRLAFALACSLVVAGCGTAARPGGGLGPNAAAARLHARDKKQDADLIKAIWERDAAAARALLKGGASANARDEFGVPVLNLAAGDGQTDIVRALLDARADVAARDSESRTALMEGAESGVGEIVALLVAKGADLRAADSLQWTALHGAAFYGRVDTVRALIEAGADVEARTDRGKSPQDLAEEMGHKDVVALLKAAMPRVPADPRP